jgi:ribokinase
VLRIAGPLLGSGRDAPWDQSVDGAWKFGPGLTLVDPAGGRLAVDLPDGWPGPCGEVALSRPLGNLAAAGPRHLRAVAWHDDLGGMGAGFAAALGGELVSALGEPSDPVSAVVAGRLARMGVVHHPIVVPGLEADWTLLITSGEFGDKLPIGFRGCHASLESLAPWSSEPCDVRVVASLPNRLAAEALRGPGAEVRVFAPAMRNMADRDCPVVSFAGAIDLLCCNRHEWESLPEREEVAWQLSVLAVTDGPNGSTVRFTDPSGEPVLLQQPAFPRSRPPRDTNRAGEAFASTLLATLLDGGWSPGVAEPPLVRRAAERAGAAAALVIDRPDFGFPGPREIDDALRAGRVDG